MDNQTQAILSIYDAAVDDSLWPDALDRALAAVQAPSCTMQMVDFGEDQPWMMTHRRGVVGSWPAEVMDYYSRNLAHHESEGWEYVMRRPIRTAVEDNEIWADMEAVRQRPDYRYLDQHGGLYRRVVARLNDNAGWFDAIALQYHASMPTIPADMKAAVNRLLPHLAKSLELSRVYRELMRRYRAVLGALDHVHVGMAITNRHGEIIAANREAERIFEARDGIFLDARRRIACLDPALEAELRHAIDRVGRTAVGQNDRIEHLAAAPLRSSARALLIEVAPLRDANREIDMGPNGVLVAIIDPGTPRPYHAARVAKVFELTTAENETCRLVVQGLGNAEIAERRNVGIETVKTQVASVLRKTQSENRADLIRRVAKICPPVAGDADGALS